MKFLDIETITRQEQVVMDDLESKLQRSFTGFTGIKGEEKPIFLRCMYCYDLIDNNNGDRLYLSEFQQKVLKNYKIGEYSHTVDNSLSCKKNFNYDTRISKD